MGSRTLPDFAGHSKDDIMCQWELEIKIYYIKCPRYRTYPLNIWKFEKNVKKSYIEFIYTIQKVKIITKKYIYICMLFPISVTDTCRTL